MGCSSSPGLGGTDGQSCASEAEKEDVKQTPGRRKCKQK